MAYEKLREIRNKKGVTARDMADLLGLMTEAAYYKKETGIIKFSIEEAKLVSNRLETPIDEVFFADEVSAKETHEDNNQAPTGTEG